MAGVRRMSRPYGAPFGDGLLTSRDRRILALARTTLPHRRIDFAAAVTALRDAVEASIAGGRVYVLGVGDTGTIVGSLVSGVGLVARAGGIEIVRVRSGGGVLHVGWFAR